MKQHELRRLLEAAGDEIRTLRRSNEVMSGQLDIVFIFDRAIRASFTTPSQGYAEDVAWKLDKAAMEIATESDKNPKGEE